MNPSPANFKTVLNILAKATVKRIKPGPPIKAPITLNKPWINLLPFSGSNAESRPSDKVVARPKRFFNKGAKVKLPTFAPKLVTDTTSELI